MDISLFCITSLPVNLCLQSQFLIEGIMNTTKPYTTSFSQNYEITHFSAISTLTFFIKKYDGIRQTAIVKISCGAKFHIIKQKIKCYLYMLVTFENVVSTDIVLW